MRLRRSCTISASFALLAACRGPAAPAPAPDGAPPPATPASFPTDWRFKAGGAADFAKHEMVVSNSAAASEAGLEILAAGGNAVDAAVATGFALAVTHPAAGNIGGGGFAIIRLVNGETGAIDYREMAPG